MKKFRFSSALMAAVLSTTLAAALSFSNQSFANQVLKPKPLKSKFLQPKRLDQRRCTR